MLPFGVGLVAIGEAAERGKALFERGQRAGLIALHHLHVADLAEADGNVAPPERVALIERQQFAADGQAFLIGGERAGHVARR